MMTEKQARTVSSGDDFLTFCKILEMRGQKSMNFCTKPRKMEK